MNRKWRQNLIWAVFILALAAVMGLLQEWSLVRQSWRGELTTRIEKARNQRRQKEFQGINTVNLAQAYALFQNGKALFIDSRPDGEYAELHIPKALHITPFMLEIRGAETVAAIAKDREIVVYCSQANCDLALQVAEKLQALGFSRVMAFMGGFRAWDEAGYPADTSK
jgi:rhodanese-related sulfurtransferase